LAQNGLFLFHWRFLLLLRRSGLLHGIACSFLPFFIAGLRLGWDYGSVLVAWNHHIEASRDDRLASIMINYRFGQIA
jgi:hypothetical protein